jgi:hypothetical protein
MDCHSGTGAGNASSRLNIGDSITNGDHGAGAAVSGTLRLVQASSDGVNCRNNAIALDFCQDFSHQIGAGPSFLEQAFSRKLGRGTLRAGRNNRCGDAYENTTGQQLRGGNILDCYLARARVLKNLFHAVATWET